MYSAEKTKTKPSEHAGNIQGAVHYEIQKNTNILYYLLMVQDLECKHKLF